MKTVHIAIGCVLILALLAGAFYPLFLHSSGEIELKSEKIEISGDIIGYSPKNDILYTEDNTTFDHSYHRHMHHGIRYLNLSSGEIGEIGYTYDTAIMLGDSLLTFRVNASGDYGRVEVGRISGAAISWSTSLPISTYYGKTPDIAKIMNDEIYLVFNIEMNSTVVEISDGGEVKGAFTIHNFSAVTLLGYSNKLILGGVGWIISQNYSAPDLTTFICDSSGRIEGKINDTVAMAVEGDRIYAVQPPALKGYEGYLYIPSSLVYMDLQGHIVKNLGDAYLYLPYGMSNGYFFACNSTSLVAYRNGEKVWSIDDLFSSLQFYRVNLQDLQHGMFPTFLSLPFSGPGGHLYIAYRMGSKYPVMPWNVEAKRYIYILEPSGKIVGKTAIDEGKRYGQIKFPGVPVILGANSRRLLFEIIMENQVTLYSATEEPAVASFDSHGYLCTYGIAALATVAVSMAMCFGKSRNTKRP